jgi:tetratricopeptide (TPR) repeat protein
MLKKLFLINQFQKSLLNYRRFATIPPASQTNQYAKSQVMLSIGIEKWNDNDLDGAKNAFLASIKLMPSSDAYFNLANVYHNVGEPTKAIENWNKSIELNPRADAHVNIANVLAVVIKDPKTALRHYRAALDLSQDDAEINYNYGVVLDATGDLEKAIEQYQIAIDAGIEPAKTNLRNARAKLISNLAVQSVKNDNKQ